MGDYLSQLLPLYLASVVEVIDVIAEIIAIVDCVARSAMERIVFGLVNICWPRFSLFWEMKGVIGHENWKDVSERLKQWRV